MCKSGDYSTTIRQICVICTLITSFSLHYLSIPQTSSKSIHNFSRYPAKNKLIKHR